MATATSTRVRDLRKNLGDIRGNIPGGFNKDYQSFLSLDFTDASLAGDWIVCLVPEVASAEEVRDFASLFRALNRRRGGELGILKATWMNLAFTAAGLDFLKVAGTDQFPREFRDGMAKRAAIIGDVDGNDPLISQASASGPFRVVTGVGNGATVAKNLTVSHFVTTTGGEYFFQPAIGALFTIAGKTPLAPPAAPDVDDDGDLDDPVSPPDVCSLARKDAEAALASAPKPAAAPKS